MPDDSPQPQPATPPPDTTEAALHDARKAMHCLYYEVDPSIARDVRAAVEKAFDRLLAEKARAELPMRAAKFAQLAHRGVSRKYTGAPYISHPARVAARTALLDNVTPEMIAAAWLHDTIEDCPKVTKEMLADEFGSEVATLVDELTNRSKAMGLSRAERKLRDHNRLRFVSDAAKQIKMLDRIDNIREMAGAPADFLETYLSESKSLVSAVCAGDPDLAARLLEVIYEAATLAATAPTAMETKEQEKAR